LSAPPLFFVKQRRCCVLALIPTARRHQRSSFFFFPLARVRQEARRRARFFSQKITPPRVVRAVDLARCAHSFSAAGTPTELLFYFYLGTLARSFSLIRVPPQLSVPTPFDRRRGVRISLSRTARRCDSVAPRKDLLRLESRAAGFRLVFSAGFRLVPSGSVPFFHLRESHHGTANVASPRFPRRWISCVSHSAWPGGVTSRFG
jgi:hypothetical protein